MKENHSFENLASQIRENGKKLLKEKRIEGFLNQIGTLYYTGSFSLDLMTWNDIDMQIVLHEGIDPIEAFCQLNADLGKDPDFIEYQMINFMGKHKPKMPRGVYVGMKIDCPDLGGMWKLDLWSLKPQDFEKNRTLMEKLSQALTSEDRNLILNIKHEMMKKTGRVPQMGSHFLYQAVLFEKIKEKDLIFKYLMAQGLSLE